MNTCEPHGRVRCGECAYLTEIIEERDEYRAMLHTVSALAPEFWKKSIFKLLDKWNRPIESIPEEKTCIQGGKLCDNEYCKCRQ